MDMSEAEFIRECLKDLAEGNRDNGRTAMEFLSALHWSERLEITDALLSMGVIKLEQRRMIRSNIYAWA